MPDNIDISTAAGPKTVATSDIGDVHYQKFKPVFGPAGTDVSDAAPLPVHTELPAATALADAAPAAPVTPTVGALIMVYDGATLARARNVTAVDDSGSTGLLAAGMIGHDVTAAVNRRVKVNASGHLYARAPVTATSVTTSVTAATSSVTLLAAKTSRVAATVFNDSTANLFLKLGAAASTTSFACKIAAGGYYEIPVTPAGVYTGIIDGIWDAANGAARVTEVG